jgi:dTDP-4-dehydrorhamnose reductase
MKVLVTGASGLLGSKVVARAEGHKVYPTHATRPTFQDSLRMDITNENDVEHAFSHIKPDVLIHTAAETNVDKCEKEREYARRVNADATRILAEACKRTDTMMVYVSTDYVFDGEKGLYSEEDEPNPVNYYGLTKLIGERHVAGVCRRYAILRTSVLYGTHPEKPNFVKWVIAVLAEGKPITVVDDHYNSPTLADNLAKIILETIEKGLEGIYHTAGNERISRYRFAVKIAETFNFDATLVQPVRMSELKAWTAKRPKDSSLCVDKIQGNIKTNLLGVAGGLREMKRQWTETT